jgi:hypothetical protein
MYLMIFENTAANISDTMQALQVQFDAEANNEKFRASTLFFA